MSVFNKLNFRTVLDNEGVFFSPCGLILLPSFYIPWAVGGRNDSCDGGTRMVV